MINKPLTLVGERGAEIRGNGKGNVVTIAADDVTLSGLRIAGSGLQLMDDDAAVFVTGNRARIENNVIADSLHGIYLKKISGAQIFNNRIQGKTTLTAANEPVEKTIGSSSENCDTTLVSNRRGNGIHQWNCEGNLIRGNEISDTRDGIYFSFTNDSRVENNLVHHVRYGLHYMYSDGNTSSRTTPSRKTRPAPPSCFRRSWWCVATASSITVAIALTDSSFSRPTAARSKGMRSPKMRSASRSISATRTRLSAIASCKITSVCASVRTRTTTSSPKIFSCTIFIPVETGGSDVSGTRWSVNGVGNLWDDDFAVDLDRDGINDLPHRELDLFGVLRRDFPAVAFLSDSPVVEALAICA